MRTFRKIAGMLFVIIMSVTLASCSDEEDEPSPVPDPTPTTPTLVGRWIEKDSSMPFTLVLNADYTGTISYDTTDTRALLTDHFNWSTSQTSNGETILSTIHTSGDIIFRSVNNLYVLAGNELIVVFKFGSNDFYYQANFRRM